jgi:TonB-linked SusC/RagA family outer membrane protein
MNKNLLLLILLLTMVFPWVHAQEMTVSGTVTDGETGESIPGVNLIVKGTGSRGTVTDFDGNYRLSVSATDVLIVSFIGYKTQEIAVGANTIIDVALRLDIEQLDEVVVIGYGVQKKKVLTGAIESVSAEEINSTPVISVDQALQGRAAGVQLLNQSGQPGEKPSIRIRGIGTDGNADPLILVDGIAVASIDNLNPADIQSMEVLKDAASTSIFGARAANGVILITTKSGSKEGRISVTYTGFYGVQNAVSTVDLLNAGEYQQVMAQAGAKDLSGTLIDPLQVSPYDTDWQKELFTRNAAIESHYVGIEGGSEKTSFASSVSYFNQEGIIGGDKSRFERYTARLNTRTDVNKIFSWGQTISYTHLTTRGVTSNGSFNGAYSSALNLDPLTPIFQTDASLLEQAPYSAEPVVTDANGNVYAISQYVAGEVVNPLARLEIQNQVVIKDQILGNIFAQIEPIKGLQLKTSVGTDLSFLDISSHRPLYFLTGTFNNIAATSLSREIQRNSVFQLENTASYLKELGNHRFNLLAGTTLLDNQWQQLTAGGQGINTDNSNLIYLDLAVDSTKTAGSTASRTTRASFFSRLLYDYNERISLSITQRRDGSSNFGANNKFANFWSFGASWVINEAPFFPKIDQLSLLKVRTSWGQNGNDRIGTFLYESTVDFNVAYNLSNGAQNGAIPAFLENQDIKWEASQQFDIGLETGFFDNRLTATFDYYKKTTKDLLQTVTGVSTLGQDLRVANIGEMENEGFEITAQWRSQKNDFKYSVGFNATYNKNTMTKVANDAGFISGASWALAGEVTRTIEGEPVVSFFGFKTDGIFQSNADVFAHINKEGDPIQPNAKPGDIRFVDVDGDGRISDNDKTAIGSPLPDWTLGSSLSMDYKGFDFSALITGQLGIDVFNGMNRPDILTSNRQTKILNQWTAENPSNDIPRLVSGDPNENYTNATDMVNIEDGSYIRLKNIQFGYRIPSAILDKINCSNWRVFVSAENLLTLTDYSGADPEVGSTVTDGNINIRDTGIDRGIYPQARTFRLGTSITF